MNFLAFACLTLLKEKIQERVDNLAMYNGTLCFYTKTRLFYVKDTCSVLLAMPIPLYEVISDHNVFVFYENQRISFFLCIKSVKYDDMLLC